MDNNLNNNQPNSDSNNSNQTFNNIPNQNQVTNGTNNMAIIKIICEENENEDDIKRDICKAFSSSKIKHDETFADPIAEDLSKESDVWVNSCISNMMKELVKELK